MGESPSEATRANVPDNRTSVAVAPSNPFVLSSDGDEGRQPTLDTAIRSSRRVAGLTLLVGRKGNGEPVRHLIGTALPWDGMSEEQAYYLNVEPGLPVGKYELTIADVPNDASWSITAYSKNGTPESNDLSMYNVNSRTASPNGDGSITVHFGASGDDCPNCLPITDGWNYIVRLYRAHPKRR